MPAPPRGSGFGPSSKRSKKPPSIYLTKYIVLCFAPSGKESTMRTRTLRALAAFVMALLAGPAPLALAESLTVSAAASLTDAVQEIAKTYEPASGDHVDFNFGASNFLERQIEEGAPVDLFLSADEASVDRLEKSGSLSPGTRRSILSNSLVIVVESQSALSVDSARVLASDRVRSVALAEPNSVPAGIYARQYLQSLEIWQKVQPKVIPFENVRATLAAVETGNVDAGIVYGSDARISKKVRVAYEVPAQTAPAISYGAGVIRASRHVEAAKKFLSFLESPAAQAIFRRYGFLPKRRS